MRIEFAAGWSWPDYMKTAWQAIDLAHSRSGTVDMISIMPPLILLPGSLPLHQIQEAVIHRPKNLGILVMIGGNRFLRLMAAKLMIRAGQDVILADSLEDARAKLAQRRNTTG